MIVLDIIIALTIVIEGLIKIYKYLLIRVIGLLVEQECIF